MRNWLCSLRSHGEEKDNGQPGRVCSHCNNKVELGSPCCRYKNKEKHQLGSSYPHYNDEDKGELGSLCSRKENKDEDQPGNLYCHYV